MNKGSSASGLLVVDLERGVGAPRREAGSDAGPEARALASHVIGTQGGSELSHELARLSRAIVVS